MFTLILPELIVILTAFLILGVDLFVSEKNRVVLAPLTLVGLGAATAAIFFQMPEAGALFGGRFAVDSVTWWFKFLFILSTGITIALSLDMLDGRKVLENAQTPRLRFRGEYYTILLFTLSGMMFLVSARDLITLYVSLELATIPLFVLASWKRDGNAGEAGLKYVIMGALASALLLYGFSLLYGLTGQTDLHAISQGLTPSPLLWLAVALIVSGIGFKMTIVPFHFWAAEVYQGAPTPITAYLSVASKGAGLALMFQLFFRVFGGFFKDWQIAIAVFAALTMTLGNLGAIVQNNIKRFMAFSAISQAGYMIMGFLGPQKESIASMIFLYVGLRDHKPRSLWCHYFSLQPDWKRGDHRLPWTCANQPPYGPGDDAWIVWSGRNSSAFGICREVLFIQYCLGYRISLACRRRRGQLYHLLVLLPADCSTNVHRTPSGRREGT